MTNRHMDKEAASHSSARKQPGKPGPSADQRRHTLSRSFMVGALAALLLLIVLAYLF